MVGMILTYRYRIKDATTARHLEACAVAGNRVWNYCCQIQREAQDRWKAGRVGGWPSAFDLIKLTTGVAASLGIHSDTVAAICRRFVASRDAKRKCPRFRASFGAKRALGWVPFIPRAVKVTDDGVTYLKRQYRFWNSRPLGGTLRAGCFAQDARGCWYVAFQCELTDVSPTGPGAVGIDLGLKELATLSTGETVPAIRHYRQYEEKLGKAQKSHNKRRVRNIHARIANARRHHLHVQTSRIVAANKIVVVGNVSPSKMAKTKMAKSVLDAGWTMLRNQLRYKCQKAGAVYVEADERWTSQVCSCCGSISRNSPKGMGGLGIRHWVCPDCGASHDRDVNAALNILRVGLERQPLAEEIPVLQGGEDVNDKALGLHDTPFAGGHHPHIIDLTRFLSG